VSAHEHVKPAEPKVLKSRVRGTYHSVEELCRVRRMPKDTIWAPGLIVALHGYHQARWVVESVTDMGVHEQPYYSSGPRQLYAIVLRNLGYFYADNRYIPPKRDNTRQLELYVPVGHAPTGSVGSRYLVEPTGGFKPPVQYLTFQEKRDLWRKRHEEFNAKMAAEKAAKGAPAMTFAKLGEEVAAVIMKPEAILDQFRVQKPISNDVQLKG
jgi:hypothetical protein